MLNVKKDSFTSSVELLSRQLPVPPQLTDPLIIQGQNAQLLDENEMLTLDSFLKFSKSNEEIKILKRLRGFYANKCMTESRRCIWNLLMVEFRRFVLDFAETKKHEDLRNLNWRFKKAGGFEEKRDKCFF